MESGTYRFKESHIRLPAHEGSILRATAFFTVIVFGYPKNSLFATLRALVSL
jgi:hypothetical protein